MAEPTFAETMNTTFDQALAERKKRASILTAFIVVVLGGWSALVPLASAVVAPGSLVVEGSAKKIQHPYGGVVSRIAVKNGDKVEEGAELARLDDTQVKANHELLRKQMFESLSREARLRAERDGATQLEIPASLKDEPQAQEILAGEIRLFNARLSARESQKSQLNERLKQLQVEATSLVAQADTKALEKKMMRVEFDRLNVLYKKKLVPEVRILTVKREIVRLDGERQVLVANHAKAQGNIAEIKTQIEGIDRTAAAEASRELRDIEARTGDLREKLTAAADQLKRTEVRSPVRGIVHELAVHTVGGVINPGETLMMIVPESTSLTIEVRIQPNEIDQVYAGQDARVRFSAFNQRSTPEVQAKVVRVAADISKDTQTGMMYYAADVKLPPESMAALGSVAMALVPGMPVEAHLQAGTRTFMSYLVKPLVDSFARSFNEE